MLLEEYFDFQAPNDIRIKGHRIGIETVLWDYCDGLTPEEIALRYPTLSLEEVYATITYYWRNQAAVDAYLQRLRDQFREMHARQERQPHPGVLRLREIIQARHRVMAGSTS